MISGDATVTGFTGKYPAKRTLSVHGGVLSLGEAATVV
jgi:hypothetical protein